RLRQKCLVPKWVPSHVLKFVHPAFFDEAETVVETHRVGIGHENGQPDRKPQLRRAVLEVADQLVSNAAPLKRRQEAEVLEQQVVRLLQCLDVAGGCATYLDE